MCNKNLDSPAKCNEFSFHFGKIVEKCLLYMGENQTKKNIHCINIMDFLNNLSESVSI